MKRQLEWYRKMQKVAPGDVSLKINIANTFHAMQQLCEARRYAQEVLKTDSQNVSALTALAYAFFEEDDYADSIPVFQQALQLDSSDFWLHNYLGQAYQKSGDHLRGIEHAWQAVTLSGGADSQHIILPIRFTKQQSKKAKNTLMTLCKNGSTLIRKMPW